MGGGKAPLEQHQLRDSRMELLRLIAMLLIVAHHVVLFSNLNLPALQPSDLVYQLNILLAMLMVSGGKVGVFMFGAISGYFLIQKPGPKPSRLVKLWLCVLFYSAGGFALACALHWQDFSVWELIRTLLPLTFGRYWFMTAFMLLMLLSPYFNLGLRSLSKAQFKALLVMLFLLWYLLSTILWPAPLYGEKFYCGEFEALCYAYACGAYWRLFPPELRFRRCLGLLCLTVLALTLVFVLCQFHARGRSEIMIHYIFFARWHSVFVPVIALSLLSCALALKPYYSRLINYLAQGAFGVYLIHSCVSLKGPLALTFWPLQNQIYTDTFALWAVVTVLISYLALALIDDIRHLLLTPLSEFLSRALARFDERYLLFYVPSHDRGSTTDHGGQ
ncbi:MAG: acyltransferase [Succinivibrio sp.]|nr:acyltransferase [Succinivibrio sp.]